MDLYQYDLETEAQEFVDVPHWIDQDISVPTVAAITDGGCNSGAYMPAVTYHQALQTMNEWGDEVLEYIEDELGEIPSPGDPASWMAWATFYLSTAVELWAGMALDAIEDQLEDE